MQAEKLKGEGDAEVVNFSACKDGVLSITLPKAEKAKAVKIQG